MEITAHNHPEGKQCWDKKCPGHPNWQAKRVIPKVQYSMARNRATVLCVKDNQLVVVRERGVTGFSLPGGGIHYGEQPISAAIRELYEECGLKVAAIRFLTRFEGRRGLHYVFVATPRDGKVKRQASEIDSIRWVSLDEPLGGHGFQGHVIRAVQTFGKEQKEYESWVGY